MTMQIQKIILYNFQGDRRTLDFKLGQVNVIVGRSNTGKSTVIQIIDYCLGRSDFDICDGVTRNTVAWYAVLFRVNDLDVFVAKPRPQAGRTKQNRAHLTVSEQILIPDLSELKAEHDDYEVTHAISRLLDSSVRSTSKEKEGHLPALHVTVEHAIPFLFQEKTVIANNHVLFYRQQEHEQSIQDTLPYFLGVKDQRDFQTEQDLEVATRNLRSLKTKQRAEESRLSTITNLEEILVEEAGRLGLIDSSHVLGSRDGLVQVLQAAVASWQPTLAPPVQDVRLPKLRADLDDLRRQLAVLDEEVHSVETFMVDAGEYSVEKNEQILRLASIEIFETQEDFFHTLCPLCNSKLDVPPPRVSALRESIERLEQSLEPEQRLLPDLRSRLAALREEKENLKRKIAQKNGLIRSIIEEQEATTQLVQQVVNQNSLVERTIGRIGLYLDLIRSLEPDSDLVHQIRELEDRVRLYTGQLNVEDEGSQLTTTLNSIGVQMTAWAKRLSVEHNGFYHLDMEKLTVVVDKFRQSISMERMGGRSNWLKCHIVAMLGLHAHFVRQARPVPNFLVLDQPAQVYFPSEKTYHEITGRADAISNSGADIEAVNRMFEFLFDVCSELAPEFQLIVLEHANLPMFKDVMIDNLPWTQDHALVPNSWIVEAEQLTYL